MPPLSFREGSTLSSSSSSSASPSSSRESGKIKASSSKLSGSKDDWALLVTYEAEKERKEGASSV